VAARLRDLIKALAACGIAVTPPANGSHWKAKKPGARTFVIPAHNGDRTQVDDNYIRALCRNFGLDVDEFKRKL